MDTRKLLFGSGARLPVLFVGKEHLTEKLPPKIDLVDWYNNQLLTRSLMNGQVKTDFGATTLMATSGLLPSKRILIFGLGSTDSLGSAQARKAVEDLDQCLKGLDEESPWLLFPDDMPERFKDEFQKSRTSAKRLAQAKIL